MDTYYKLNISMAEFQRLLQSIRKHIEEGSAEMNAIEFVKMLRAEHHVIENIHGYLFGFSQRNWGSKASLLETVERGRERNIQNVKTFNLVKKAVWSCALLNEHDGVEKADQRVNLVLLWDLMSELMTFIDFYELKYRHQVLLRSK